MHMTRKLALVDYNKCQPGECEEGICVAAQACPSKLLRQETYYSAPMPEPSACRACGECVRACPLKAIRLIRA